MNCPGCDGKTRVMQTFPVEFHDFPAIKRRHKCLECQLRFKSVQLTAASLDALIDYQGLKLALVANDIKLREK